MNKELEIAYKILKNIYSKGAFSSIELNKQLTDNDEVSHGQVTKIVYGVLENDILLDYYLKQFYSKKPKQSVLVLLKIGAYVSQFLNSIPNFALVNELVRISKSIDKSISGFVNATLKNVVNGKINLPNEQDIVEFLSVKHSYPKWLVKMLIDQQGVEFVKEFLNHNFETFTHVRVNLSEITLEKFKELLNDHKIEHKASKLKDGVYVNYQQLLKEPSLTKYYIVIGITSANLCNLINPKPNSLVFDACASPGNKSLYLSQIQPTIKIVAGELHPHRVELINALTKKYGVSNITAIQNDATILNPEFENKFDLIVCDVPCSGIGIAGKKPDILLNRKESDIQTLHELQFNILTTSSKYLKVGGELFYSTCTILKQENDYVINRFLKRNPNFKLVEIKQPNEIKAVVSNNYMLNYYPHISGTEEGFFVAKLVKEK